MSDPGRDPRREKRSVRQIQDEVNEEIRFHLDQRTAELESLGWNPQEAREEARRRFGDIGGTAAACAESDWRWERALERRVWLSDLGHDLAHGVRQLRARPRFSVPIVLTLAIGIGAATAIFGAADQVLVRPLPFHETGRVVTLWESDRATGGGRRQVSPGNFLEWSQRLRSFSAMGVAAPNGVDLTGSTPPVPARTWDISDGFLEALGVTPAAGRLFLPEEYAPGHDVVLLSYDFWQRHFDGDSRIVGSILAIDQRSHRIVGVLPRGMVYPEEKDLWMPKSFRPDERNDRRSSYMDAVARLAPGVSLAGAQADLDRVSRQLGTEHPQTNATLGTVALPLSDHLLGRVRTGLLVLLAAVILMLLIACANVAGLLIARGIEREREFAIRSALGADRGRLARQLLAEVLLLATLGGAIGTWIAWSGTRLLVAGSPEWLPRASSLGFDGRVLAIALALTLLSAVLFGLLPALRFSKTRTEGLLVGGRVTAGRRGRRLRRAIVVGELALALVLLTGAGLLIRSFTQVLANDVGFSPEHRASIQLFLWDRNPTPAGRLMRMREIDDALRAIPGVEAVGRVSALPFHPSQIDAQGRMVIEGRAPGPRADAQVYTTIASPGYFGVMGIARREGRLFGPRDRADQPLVAIVNETLARRFFPGEDPIGKRVTVGVMAAPRPREIVGVVADVRPTAYDSEPRPELFVPYEQSASGSVTFVARTSGDPGRLLPSMHAAVARVDPLQTIYHAATLEDLMSRTTVERRFYLSLMVAFSLVALVLAGFGVYGLMSMTAIDRTHEIGVRLALGARPSDIVRMMLGDGLRMIAAGLALGLLGSLWFARGLRSMLYHISDADPSTLAPVAAVLAIVAVVAVLIPALRSSRVDPMGVLRHD